MLSNKVPPRNNPIETLFLIPLQKGTRMPPAGNNRKKQGKNQQSVSRIFLTNQLKESWLFMLLSSFYLRTMLEETKVSKIRRHSNGHRLNYIRQNSKITFQAHSRLVVAKKGWWFGFHLFVTKQPAQQNKKQPGQKWNQVDLSDVFKSSNPSKY